MTRLHVFDKPMCCSTGVCGPQVDPALPRLAADLAWLQEQGVAVERFNLAQQPEAFVANADVKATLQAGYETALPLVCVDGQIVSKGVYPSRNQLAQWCGLKASARLNVVDPARSCCSGATKCD